MRRRHIIIAICSLLVITQLSSFVFSEGNAYMFNSESIQVCTPYSFDSDLAAEKNLADENGFTAEYFKLQHTYAEALMSYLDEKCNIHALDAEFAAHEMRFIANENPENIYQKNCNFGMQFLFLRNNINIERLEEDDLQILRGAVYGDVELLEMIQRTYKTVIAAYVDDNPNLMVAYEMDGKIAPNSSVVIGFAMDSEYTKNGDFVDVNHEMEKDAAIEAALPMIQEQLTRELGFPVVIFHY